MTDILGMPHGSAVDPVVLAAAEGENLRSLSIALLIGAAVLIVSIAAVRLSTRSGLPSLLLYLAPELARMDQALDFELTPKMLARYRPGHSRQLPQGSPGSVGYPSLASAQKGELLYKFILDRISSYLAGN